MLQHDHDEITQNFQVVTLVFFIIYPEKLLLGPARRSSRSKIVEILDNIYFMIVNNIHMFNQVTK